ncbi:MAG TPA: M24 family metallopeptidase, partial [Methanophagales archaeon]|nr:M24 family metallopeptidase [Methanophagales archaeon]
TIGDIGNAIERYISSQGFSVIRDLCGHGIGTRLHQDPQVLNYGKRHSGPKLKRGMVVCPEPMASLGDYRIVKGKDGFTYKTKDNSLAVHFEHTVALTEKGAEVLTTI